MNRHALFVVLLVVLVCGVLSADRISYFKAGSGKRVAEHVDNVAITAWNAASVSYRDAKGASIVVQTANVITISRSVGAGGSMGEDLRKALEMIAQDPAGAKSILAAAAGKGSEMDREEAAYRRAELLENEARGNGRTSLEDAIKEYAAYHSRYRAGYFAQDSYPALAGLQLAAKRAADARATLRAMISASPALARAGNQKLGEFEVTQGDFKAAQSAFKAAENASSDNTNARYLAIAWQGAAIQKQGENTAARDMLEKITGDEAFEDADSEEDEQALAVAWHALGDAQFALGSFEKAYAAYVMAGYFAWWNQADNEGPLLAQACICAKKLQGTDEEWKLRYDKLRATLAVGFPRELQRVDEAK